MPTVMLTATCQNSCPWCFARSKMEHYRSQSIAEIEWQDSLTVVTVTQRWCNNQRSCLGRRRLGH